MSGYPNKRPWEHEKIQSAAVSPKTAAAMTLGPFGGPTTKPQKWSRKREIPSALGNVNAKAVTAATHRGTRVYAANIPQ
jgi:hypothetical protein